MTVSFILAMPHRKLATPHHTKGYSVTSRFDDGKYPYRATPNPARSYHTPLYRTVPNLTKPHATAGDTWAEDSNPGVFRPHVSMPGPASPHLFWTGLAEPCRAPPHALSCDTWRMESNHPGATVHHVFIPHRALPCLASPDLCRPRPAIPRRTPPYLTCVKRSAVKRPYCGRQSPRPICVPATNNHSSTRAMLTRDGST